MQKTSDLQFFTCPQRAPIHVITTSSNDNVYKTGILHPYKWLQLNEIAASTE